MCTFSTRWRALSVFGVDRRLLAEDGHIYLTLADAILLLPSVHLQASSVSSGVSDLRVWQTHVATNTLSLCLCLSVSLCMQRGMCAYKCVRDRVWSAWTVAGLKFILFWFRFFFPVYKSHINTACLVTVRFSRSSTFVVTVAEVW